MTSIKHRQTIQTIVPTVKTAVIILSCAIAAGSTCITIDPPFPTDEVTEIPSISALSVDGSVAVGGVVSDVTSKTKPSISQTSPVVTKTEAYRSSAASGVEMLGFLPGGGGGNSLATGISADGSVAVGISSSEDGNRPFRWTRLTGMTTLSPVGAEYSFAFTSDVSADGQTIIGFLTSDSTAFQGFRWSAATGYDVFSVPSREDLGTRPIAVSANGTIIAGGSDSGPGERGFYRTENDGTVLITDPTDEDATVVVADMSEDGTTVVGRLVSDGEEYGFRWTADAGLVRLSGLPGDRPNASAFATTADGSLVVGRAGTGAGEYIGDLPFFETEPVIWDAQGNIHRLADLLSEEEAAKVAGITMTQARVMSADGTTIAGIGTDSENQSVWWIVRIDPTAL